MKTVQNELRKLRHIPKLGQHQLDGNMQVCFNVGDRLDGKQCQMAGEISW